MKKAEEKELFDGLKICLEYLEEIYKLSSFTKKYCDLNQDSDELYRISEVVNIITKISNETSLNLYRLISSYTNKTLKNYDLTLRKIFKT